MSLLAQMIEKRAALQVEIDTLLAAVETETRSLTDEESADFDAKAEEIRSLDERIVKLDDNEKRAAAARELAAKVTPVKAPPVAVVTSEERTYRPTPDRSQHSMVRDLFAFKHNGNMEARDRLIRNTQEVTAAWEKRTGVTTTNGAGGEFAPPLWAVEDYVELARPGRPLADVCMKQELPSGVSSINLPSITAGSTVAAQSTQNTTVSNTTPTTSSVTGSVKTEAGYVLISQQELDQSPINMDQVILQDLSNAYAGAIDTAVVTALASAATEGVTFTQASPTTVLLLPNINNAIANVHTNRYLPPTHIAMTPARWQLLLSAKDTANRPLITNVANYFNSPGEGNTVQSQGVVGSLFGLPVLVDPNIPTNLGGGTNQDEIFVLKADDNVLYESVPYLDTQPGQFATTLSVVVRFWRYYAFLCRYPASIAPITGTGMVPYSYGS